MSRFTLILALLASAFSSLWAGASRRPNLLWIITDEHNFRTLGCYRDTLPRELAFMWGPTVVETPNIDSIAREGALFTSMYASSPVCTPSRASMFTGLYPQNTGAPKNDLPMRTDIPTIASVLSKAGYIAGYAGKWHLSGEAKPGWAPSPSYGFQDNRFMFNRGHWKKLGWSADGAPRVAAVNAAGEPVSRVEGADETSYTTDWLTDRALSFIDDHARDPFFFVLSIPDPHTPNTVRAPYDRMFDTTVFKKPATWDLKIGKNEPKWRQPDGKAEDLQPMIRQYFGMVKCIDDNVGRILARLRERGILDDTIVVFSSDHGDLLGEHRRVNKGTPHEASARIPFIVRCPRAIQPGTVINQAANTVDWMPTFLTLLGVPVPAGLEGRDLTPLLRGSAEGWNDITFMRMGGWFAAVTDHFKLVVDDGPAGPWLSDLEVDPNEIDNHLHDPALKGVVNHLAAALQEYARRTNDPLLRSQFVRAHLDALLAGKE